MSEIYELTEIIDKKWAENETIPETIVQELKEKTKNFIGIAQINPIAGNIEYNAKKIAKRIKLANDLKLEMVIFPELALCGCPLEDTIGRYTVIAEDCLKWLEGLASVTKDTTAIIGFLEPAENKKYYSSLGILRNGKIQNIIRKSSITNSFGFNDCKYMESGNSENVFDDYGITICEDCYIDSKIKNIIKKNPRVIINCCALPEIYKRTYQNIPSFISSKHNIPFIYVNQTGTTDSTSFGGSSCVYDNKGKLIARAKAFDEQFLLVDIKSNTGKIYPSCENNVEQICFSMDYEPEMEHIYKTSIQGIKDYFAKCGLKRAVLGLSGGLDSTVCAVLLTDALGKENVYGISMPSKITTEGSKSDAEELAKNLGISFAIAPISEMVNTTGKCFDKLFEEVEKSWKCRYKKSFTPDNIQARSRAMYLWGVSNEFESCIPIATSDKSEIYMGYATINGDMSGGFAPIADITKTKLFAFAKWLNKNRIEKNAIPESVILKRPGAELAIDPKTGKPLCAEDALMPYEFMDEIIWRIENKNETYQQLLDSDFLYEKHNRITKEQKQEWLDKFYRRMSTALYKWSILAPAVTLDKNSILNKNYKHPITAGKINYEGQTPENIASILESL